MKTVVDTLMTVHNESSKIGNASTVTAHEAFRVLDCFKIRRPYTSIGNEKNELSVFGSADDKSRVFSDRFKFIKKHLTRINFNKTRVIGCIMIRR